MNTSPLRILCTASLCLSLNSVQDCNAQVSSCTNSDFELGTLSGWSGTTGFCCPINSTVPGFVGGRHTIVTGGTDPNTGNQLNCVAPGGSYSLRLGNSNTGAEAEQIKYTFVVTPQTQLFIYRYAVVLEDPGHPAPDQPRFQIAVADQSGAIDYTCGFYSVVSAPGLPGFNTTGNVHWKNWTTIGIDLTSKMGNTITITFSTGDCGYGGHFGYAYIDCMCYPFNVVAEYCPGGLFANLSAPPGFVSYLWSTGQTTPSITINNATVGDTVAVTMTSITGCQVTLNTVLKASIVASSFILSDSCFNSTQFIDASYIVTGSPIAAWYWDFGDGTSSTLQNPVHQYSNAGTYLVTLYVTNQGGCQDSTSQFVSLYSIPTASFVTTPVCPKSANVFLNQSSFTPPDTITQYYWNFGDGSPSSNLQSPIHSFNIPGNYQVTLIAISNKGCADTSIVTVSPLPYSIAGFTTQSLCNNTTINFTDTSKVFNGSISSWTWDFGDGSLVSNQQNPTHQYLTPGIYTVSLIVITDSVCASSFSSQVAVLNYPIAAFSFGQACENNEVIFNDNSQLPGATITNWQWNFGDGSPLSTLDDPAHIYTQSGNYSVNLIVTASNGCTDTINHSITVLDSPVAAFTTTSACPGNNMQCSDLTTITGSTITLHLWNFGDNTPFSPLPNPQHIYSSSGAYNITLIVVAANGCKDTISQQIQTSPLPIPVLIATSGCQFSPLAFNSSSFITGGHIDTTYWNYGDGSATETGLTTTHIYTAPGYYNITLTLISDNGCISTTSDQVLVSEVPQADFISNNVCSGQSSLFINQTPSIPFINQVMWNTGDNNSYNGNDTLYHLYQIDSTYLVTLIVVSDSGCADTISHAVTVYPLPSVGFVTAGTPCENDKIQFTSTSTPGKGFAHALWLFSDGQTASSDNTTHQFNTGQHINTLIITDENGCIDSTSKMIEIHPYPLISFTTDNVCDGIPAYFTGFANCSDSVTIYNWGFGDSTMAYQINSDHLYDAPGNYTVTFMASSINSCTSITNSDITVYPNPVAAFSTGVSCSQNPVSMYNQSTILSGSLSGMLWDFGDSTLKSTEYNPVHIYIQPGSYNVSLTAESDNGCVGQHLQPVPVNYLPVASFSNDTACALSPTTFLNTSTVTNSSIGQSFWLFENGASDTTFSPQYSYSSSGIKNVSLIVITNEGCVDSVTKPVKVCELPQPDFIALPSEGCVPLFVKFKNLSQSADGAIINWNWQLNSNNSSVAVEPGLIYNDAGLHDITLMVTTDVGCSNTILKPEYINVHPLPVAKFSFANNKPDILTPFVEIIDESVLGFKWMYDFGDNTTSDNQNPSHNYPKVGKYNVEQVVETEFGCLDSTYRIIEVNNVYTLYIPNSFTPNSDGLNDEFIYVGIGIVDFSIAIYDRWGKQIFSADDMNKTWNGMVNNEYAKEDTYFYIVNARDIFKKQHSITGQVSVVY